MRKRGDLQLRGLRERLDLGQTEMAKRMGLGLRAYQELESNPGKLRKRHIRLAESVASDMAIEKKDPYLAPPSVHTKAVALVALLIGGFFQEHASELAELLRLVWNSARTSDDGET
jgi:DNA-binding XRE family transcriptional regulator